jgi:hypothetical protein
VKVWVNGDLVNHGTNCTASSGQIAIQAEGSEVEFRKLLLTPITKLTDAASPSDASEFKTIFNGKGLIGWEGDQRLWSVKDGVIRGETMKDKKAAGNTFLIWKDGKLKDFELQISFRCNATNNSGIQYRSQRVKGRKGNDWVVRGYQHEIRNQDKLPSVAGFIYDEKGSRGRICQVGEKAVWGADNKKKVTDKLIDAAGFEKLFKLNDWNDVRIIAKGNHVQHYMNGKLILDFTDNDPKRAFSEGVLALQLHAGAPMWVEFRDIRLRQFK